MCNDFNQIFKYYGIEAARTILIREFSYAFERGGNEVNYHHLSLLVDQMTFTGHILSIDRHGMSKSDKSPFTRATFEKSTEHMINAAIFGESDNMNGVSSRIMTGQVMKGGTGLCNIVLDTDFIEQSEHNKNHTTYTNKVIVNKENTTVAVPKNIFIPE